MKKVVICLVMMLLLTGCGKTKYQTGMYSDVREWDFYTSAVEFCVNEGYMVPEGDEFGAYEPVTLSECADIMAKLKGVKTDNPIEYVIKEKIVPRDFGEWDVPCKREVMAYMLSKTMEHTYINNVIEGAVSDADESFAENEIYSLYRMGIFSGDKGNNAFRPMDNVVRSEMAIVIERACNKDKRLMFDMSRLDVTMVAFGDTIGHEPVIKAGKTADGYNFDKLFENVRPYVEGADVACVNQETVFVENNFTGYPSFGSPEEIGIAEVEAGFDVITHATNHAFDRGTGGILYTTQFWNNQDVIMLGIHENEDDAKQISVIKRNGIKIAMLNYTYSLNGYRLPKGKEYMVDILDEEKIKLDMACARNISDAIVVFAHWGNEYQNKPSQSQKDWAQLFADEGATVIVGHHPHVVQPLDFVIANDGREVPVYYSLGNFISNQNDYQNALCAMADFKIVKDEKGIRCESAEIEPVITHMENGYYSAYLLNDYTDEKINSHKHKGKYGQRFTKEAYQEVFNNIVGE